jgi:hypothetical protein
MHWYKTIEDVLKARCGQNERRFYTTEEGYFVAEGWIAKRMAEEGVNVIELAPYEVVQMAQDWGILRTCGVASVFHGTRAQAICHARELNSTDDSGASEIVTRGMSKEAAMEWLEAMK